MKTSLKILVPALLLLATPLFAADWNMFHGPDGKNRSSETGLLTSWSEGGPTLLWRIDSIGEGVSGYSSVTIQNGRLFTSGERDGRIIVYCFDLDGNKLWEADNGPTWRPRNFPGPRSTPTVDGEFVYDLSPNGELVCLRVENGERVWGRNILTDFEGQNIIWGLSESIRIDGDRLYVAPGGAKASFVALNKRTGEVIWTTPSLGEGERTSYGSPIIFEHDGLRMVVTTYAQGMFGVNPETGELLFRFRHPQLFGINSTRPIYHDGYIYLTNTWDDRGNEGGGEGGVKLRLTVTDGKVSLEEVWRDRTLDSLHDNVMLIDGFLYGVSFGFRGGAFVCLNWETGEMQYYDRSVGRGSSLIWAEGLLYLLCERGDVLLIRPTPERFDVISRFALPDDGEGPVWAHPVIHGKRLYIRHGTFLYCFDIAR